MEKFFKLKENGTDVKTEIIAGITTFMTMAYILAVNPNILSAAGMDRGAVFTATAIASFVGTLLMALFANYPFALAPGMGLNAYFAYTVVLGMGYTWETALTAVFVEGIIFILLSVTSVREAIFNAVPRNLKSAVSVGIGLFIAFIGLQNAKIVIGGATLVELFSIDGYNKVHGVEGAIATTNDAGITVIIAIIGVLITAFLVVKEIKGNILLGILATWILGIIAQLSGLYVPNPALGFYSVLPDFSNGLSIPSIGPVLFKLQFDKIASLEFVVVMFAFLFVDMFDTIGTLIGVSTKAGMLDKDGKLPNIRGALLADAVATTAGAMLGTTTVTTFVESASGVAEGGRTGLYEYKDQHFIKHYGPNNSILESALADGNPNYVLIQGLGYDTESRLWILNSQASSQSIIAYQDHEFKAFKQPQLMKLNTRSLGNMRNLFFDSR